MSADKTKLKLEKSKDWNFWLAVVKGKVVEYQIWNKIDFLITFKPRCLIKPQKIEPSENENDVNALIKYKFQLTAYKQKRVNWEREHEELNKINELIYDIISVANLIYIQKMKVHFWNMLTALKERLISSNSVRIINLEQQYAKIKKEPINRQSIETWLNEYVQLYILKKEHDVVKLIIIKRAYCDFILTIESYAFWLIQTYKKLIDTTEENQQEKLLFKFFKKFRNHIRL